MTTTIRGKWMAELRRRLESVAGVGLVVEVGGDDPAIAETLSGATPQAVLEIYDGTDEKNDSVTVVHEFLTTVEIVVHLPALPGDVDQDWFGRAHDLCAAIYATYGASDDAGQLKADANPANPPLVTDCELKVFCGGVSIAENGSRMTFQSFEVKWRFRRGDPAST